MSSICEVLELGPIVASNEDLGLLVTANGSYLNMWCAENHSQWTCVDCRPLESEQGLYSLPTTEVMHQAEQYLDAAVSEHNHEEEYSR